MSHTEKKKNNFLEQICFYHSLPSQNREPYNMLIKRISAQMRNETKIKVYFTIPMERYHKQYMQTRLHQFQTDFLCLVPLDNREMLPFISYQQIIKLLTFIYILYCQMPQIDKILTRCFEKNGTDTRGHKAYFAFSIVILKNRRNHVLRCCFQMQQIAQCLIYCRYYYY